MEYYIDKNVYNKKQITSFMNLGPPTENKPFCMDIDGAEFLKFKNKSLSLQN